MSFEKLIFCCVLTICVTVLACNIERHGYLLQLRAMEVAHD